MLCAKLVRSFPLNNYRIFPMVARSNELLLKQAGRDHRCCPSLCQGVVSKTPAPTCPALQQHTSSWGAEQQQDQETRRADLRALYKEKTPLFLYVQPCRSGCAGSLIVECCLPLSKHCRINSFFFCPDIK